MRPEGLVLLSEEKIKNAQCAQQSELAFPIAAKPFLKKECRNMFPVVFKFEY